MSPISWFSNQMFTTGTFLFLCPAKKRNCVYMPALKGTSIKELGEIHGTRDSKPNKGRAADSDQSFQEKGQLWRKTV